MIYIHAESGPTYPYENAVCLSCTNGILNKTNPSVIFKLPDDESSSVLTPVFDAHIFKCNHCQILIQSKEFKNGYFQIPIQIK